MPLNSPAGLLGLAVMGTILLIWLGAAVSEFFLGRYLAKHYPDTWISLGRPGKIGSFGRERDHLSSWLQSGGFEMIGDTKLQAKCLFVRRLGKISIISFVTGILGMLCVLFLTRK